MDARTLVAIVDMIRIAYRIYGGRGYVTAVVIRGRYGRQNRY
jgi:hypothetical protein